MKKQAAFKFLGRQLLPMSSHHMLGRIPRHFLARLTAGLVIGTTTALSPLNAIAAPRCEGAFEGAIPVVSTPAPRGYKPWVDESNLFEADPLLRTRRAQKAGDNSVLKGTEATKELFDAFLALKGDFLQNRNIVFDEAPSQVLRMIDYDHFKDFKTKNPDQSGAKIYGLETIQAWKEADDYLASIPIGEFKLTTEVIQKVGGISGRSLKPFPIRIPHITPDLSGDFKWLPNSGREPLREPLTEDQYIQLKQNKFITGFLELPWPFSKKNSRRGIILYALPHTVKGKLKKLTDWYEANKDTMDPIRLAVEFQRSFISIHPYVDGNGRGSRLLMDRILLEHGLPPTLILEHNMDLYASLDAYEAVVRAGVADSINLLKNELYERRAANKVPFEISSLEGWDYSGGTALKKWADQALVTRYSELTHFNFQVGDKKFSLRNDGFIYDQYGIPHEYYNGRFYPIADRMTEFYDFGGETQDYKSREQVFIGMDKRTYEYKYRTRVVQRVHRLLSPLKKNVFSKHLRIVEKIKENQINVKGLTVEPTATIAKANAAGDPFIYPWQQIQLAQTFSNQTDSVEDLLSPFYVADTTYSQSVRNGEKPSSTQTLAQYEHLDMALYDYEKAASRQPKLKAAIVQYRTLIHKIARAEVMKDLDLFNALSKEDQDIAKSDFRFQLFQEYFAISKLSHPTLLEAQKAGFDQYVPLMRNSNKMSAELGFIPSPVIRAVLMKVPYFKSVLSWAEGLKKEVDEKGEDVIFQRVKDNKRLPEFAKKRILAKLEAAKGSLSTALSGFIKEITNEPGTQTPYSLAGQRLVWSLKNRAQGDDEGELGLSFSTSPELYYNGSVFANGSGKQVVVSVLRAPRDSVIQNYVSSFAGEYEVVNFKAILRPAIARKFDGEEMNKKANFKSGSKSLRQAMRELLGISTLSVQDGADGEFGDEGDDHEMIHIDAGEAVG